MIAFEITINGTLCEETGDIIAVTLAADDVREKDAKRIVLHGQSADGRVQLLDAHLSVGDEVRIRVVELEETASSPRGCSYCARNVDEIARLIQGTQTAICDDCSGGFAASILRNERLPLGAALHDSTKQVCGFCQNANDSTAGLIVRNGAAVCPRCVRACQDLFEQG